ncbi:MAG TPA: sulfur carrier protein ThiS [Phycisphaerae bacterium]|nr:sulfur carrier protein ThiS [Phycisphaerae bacterium]HUU23282.1 sulfur carrier protein ThiS [Phycisphaerae bacterium]
MQIRVNGRPQDVPAGATVADLVHLLALEPRRIAVERNKRLVRRTEYADTALTDGDVVEIVTLVGGG